MMDQLGFQGMEEAFRHGIVPTIALSAHALPDAIQFEQFPVAVWGIMAAPIGMP